MKITELLETVQFAKDPKTKKGELVEIVETLAKEYEKILTEPTPKSAPVAKECPKCAIALPALAKCAKREVSITARRALKELG